MQRIYTSHTQANLQETPCTIREDLIYILKTWINWKSNTEERKGRKKTMKKRLIAFVLMLCMVAVPLTSFAVPERASVMVEMADSSKGLSFTTTTLDGKSFSSSVFKEYDLIVLNCWGEWCGICVWELPYLQKISKNYKNVLILGLWYGYSVEEALAVAREAGVTYPLIHSNNDLKKYLWATNGFPHTFFFNCLGEQVGEMAVGGMDYYEWEDIIKERLPMASIGDPGIITQPKDVTVYTGENASFHVEAKGENVTYQWYGRANSSAAWRLLEGKTANTLTVQGTAENNGSQYYCLVKSAKGEVKTNVATLTVKQPTPPTITSQPRNVKVKSGAKAKFTVKVKDKGVTFQWFEKAAGTANWTILAGETNTTLTVVGSKTNNGAQYRCRVKGSHNAEVYTNAATLTVQTQAPVIKTQPKSITVKSGAKAKFTVKVSGKNLQFKWFSRPNADADWTVVAGETKATLNLVGSMDKNGWEFCCEIQNPDGKVRTNPAKLTVTPQVPKVSAQPKDVKAKVGAKATFKVKASPKNVTYQWYYRTSETGEWIKIEGATNASYAFKVTEAQFGCQFRCLVRNADGEAWSKAATLIRK